ncbi:MAG: flagellin, partial [Oscillospiraceae bacterium]
MVVRTNTMSANAYRQLGMNNGAVAKSLEKLSSGFRINRAGDDASGLAISEKMKAQIKGLEQASANSQDGISLVQTAEGALTEVHGMLNRMVELATKSANGTIQDKVDREAIQTEVNALNTEITRISKSTNFNGINLLDGSLSANSAKASVTNMGATLGKGFGAANTALAGKTALTASVVKDWSGITTSTAGTFTFETGSYDTAGKFTAGTGATADTV